MRYPALYHNSQYYARQRQRRNRWLFALLLVVVVVISNRCTAAYRPARQVKVAEAPGVWACR